MQIKDLTKEGSNLQLTVLAEKVAQGVATNGTTYLSITLKDKTGTIEARLWDAKPLDLETWVKGNFYEVNINIIEYRRILQAKINSYNIVDPSEINLDDFLETAPINAEEMYQEITNFVNNLQEPVYKKMMELILLQYGEDFKVWPAAIRNHHEIKSGLLWHSLTMLKMAESLRTIYSDRLIDFELLGCGVILHDLGKVIEISVGTVSDFSLAGKLLGHISIMGNEIHRIAKENGIVDDKVLLLEHLVLASHGKLEFGSPVEPHLLEAEILSFLDNLDARIYRIDRELDKINANDQTPRLLPIENRWFIKHFDKNK
ncbi:3'-5' exoribonuclease YhaM [Spiroplasma syrphidicola EA-1]|uniref:3'-5' exoribonuclease YhaM n=1 Tax=Spiroplasma syrphidicola EA-1 TaxID=1276229 RepID=R4UIA3_9MOLU|nr:HD domain-containing protein [Spiroplasma syrphidicola]AGM25885.1 3'-5' exoribonuclease YhaM [Spiroplasma syrphidicola EA-1]